MLHVAQNISSDVFAEAHFHADENNDLMTPCRMSLFALSLQFLVGMVVTILTDIIHFGIYYPISDLAAERGRDVFRFSAGMAILNLLIKPVSCFFVYQMYRERGGDYNVNFGKCVRMSQGQKLEGFVAYLEIFSRKTRQNEHSTVIQCPGIYTQ